MRTCEAAVYHGCHEDCWVHNLVTRGIVSRRINGSRHLVYEQEMTTAGRVNFIRWSKD